MSMTNHARSVAARLLGQTGWRRSLTFTTILTVGVLVATPSAVTFFRSTFAAAQFPEYGFDDSVAGCCTQWTRTAAAGQGYNGGDALLLTQLPGAGDYGWGLSKVLAVPAQGATRFVRWRMMWSADTNFRARQQESGEAIPYSSGKLLMWPSSGGSGIRSTVLWESQHDPSVTGRVKLYLGDASGGYQTDYVIERGQWAHIQLRVQSSSACGSSNGSMTIWVNNNSESSPTRVRGSSSDPWVNSSTGWNICTADWDSIRLGAYQNKGLQSGGVNKIYYSAFEVADTFDPAWSGGSQSSTPSAPRNLRVVGSGLE